MELLGPKEARNLRGLAPRAEADLGLGEVLTHEPLFCDPYGLGGPPHPVIVTVRDNRDYTKVLLYSYYTTRTGWGVLLTCGWRSVFSIIHQGFTISNGKQARVAQLASKKRILKATSRMEIPKGFIPHPRSGVVRF